MSDKKIKIPSRRGKVTTTEEIRRMRNKNIVPDMRAMKTRKGSRNSDGKLYLNADHPSVTKNELKRFNKIFSQGTGAGSAPHTLSERQVHNAYSMMKKKFVNPKDGSPDNLTNKEIKDLIYRKGQTDVRVNPVPKKITPAKQKAIKQAAPVIKRIVEGDKRKVKLAPKPEKPIVLKKMGGGSLKNIPAGNKGLPNLPTATRNKMGFKKHGGKITYRMSGGQVVAGSYE
mgnify:CR=1 FL=1